MPFQFSLDSRIVSCHAVYSGFFDAFSREVASSSSRVRHSWACDTPGAYFRHMQKFALSNECDGPNVYTCTGALSLGSNGVLFKYGGRDNGRSVYCVKFIPHVWTPPRGLSKCGSVVSHDVVESGRVQFMACSSGDLWSLSQTMSRAHKTGTIDDRLRDVQRVCRVSHFLASSVAELLTHRVVMTDMKLENILVDGAGSDETYRLCDVESFSELDGSSVHPTRCTFEPCKRSTACAVLTTAFAAACTAIDFANSLVDTEDQVDFSWCGPGAVLGDTFGLSHPVVVSSTKLSNAYTEPWVFVLRALAGHRIWGNQELDRAFVLSVFARLETRTRLALDLSD
jgi:hypothetical protein